MSTEALNKIIKEVDALTPQERRELLDRSAHDEQDSPLRKWLTKARNMRAELSLTSDSVESSVRCAPGNEINGSLC